jgi:hypothetical protein
MMLPACVCAYPEEEHGTWVWVAYLSAGHNWLLQGYKGSVLKCVVGLPSRQRTLLPALAKPYTPYIVYVW